MFEDAKYFEARLRHSEKMAQAAVDPAIARIHDKFVDVYQKRLCALSATIVDSLAPEPD